MLRKLALAVTSVVLMLCTLESVTRLAHLQLHQQLLEYAKYGLLQVDDDSGHYLRHFPGASAVILGQAVHFNSLGMRDEEPRVPKPPGVFRLLCVGDSMTLGLGAPQQDIWPAGLRRLLKGAGVDVVAAGVGGWDTVEAEHFLRANLERLDPDLVLLMYCNNDNEPTEPIRRALRPATTLGSRLYRTLVLHSRLFEWGAYIYTTRFARPKVENLQDLHRWFSERAMREKQYPPFSVDEPGWLESRAALSGILELTRARGIPFVIFLYNLGNLPPGPAALERLREFGAETRVPVFDTFPMFGDEPLESLMVVPGDIHPSARGHSLLAEGMARILRAEHLVPSPPQAH